MEVKETYLKAKYRPVGALLKFFVVIYFKFKLHLSIWKEEMLEFSK